MQPPSTCWCGLYCPRALLMNAHYCQQSEADLVQVPASSAVSRKPVPSGLGGLRCEPSGPPKPTAALPSPSAPACFLDLFYLFLVIHVGGQVVQGAEWCSWDKWRFSASFSGVIDSKSLYCYDAGPQEDPHRPAGGMYQEC